MTRLDKNTQKKRNDFFSKKKEQAKRMTSPFRVNEINILLIHRILYYVIFLNLNLIIKIANILRARLGLRFKNNNFKMYDLKT
jgi:hypothetical protein